MPSTTPARGPWRNGLPRSFTRASEGRRASHSRAPVANLGFSDAGWEFGAKGTGLSLGIDRKETGRKAPLELSAKHTIDRMAPAARQQNSEILQHQ